MPDHKQSLIRKLKVQSSELKEELDFIRGVYDLCVTNFCAAVSSFCDESGVKNPLLDIGASETKKENEILDDELKCLFRQIAKKTHTDITKSEDSRPILEEAVKAKKENKSSNLLSIAHNLKLDTSSLSYKSISVIESSITELEKEINTITKSYPWLWYHASENRKINIIQEFIDSKV